MNVGLDFRTKSRIISDTRAAIQEAINRARSSFIPSNSFVRIFIAGLRSLPTNIREDSYWNYELNLIFQGFFTSTDPPLTLPLVFEFFSAKNYHKIAYINLPSSVANVALSYDRRLFIDGNKLTIERARVKEFGRNYNSHEQRERSYSNPDYVDNKAMRSWGTTANTSHDSLPLFSPTSSHSKSLSHSYSPISSLEARYFSSQSLKAYTSLTAPISIPPSISMLNSTESFKRTITIPFQFGALNSRDALIALKEFQLEKKRKKELKDTSSSSTTKWEKEYENFLVCQIESKKIKSDSKSELKDHYWKLIETISEFNRINQEFMKLVEGLVVLENEGRNLKGSLKRSFDAANEVDPFKLVELDTSIVKKEKLSDEW